MYAIRSITHLEIESPLAFLVDLFEDSLLIVAIVLIVEAIFHGWFMMPVGIILLGVYVFMRHKRPSFKKLIEKSAKSLNMRINSLTQDLNLFKRGGEIG